jgi:hypothetical protein
MSMKLKTLYVTRQTITWIFLANALSILLAFNDLYEM